MKTKRKNKNSLLQAQSHDLEPDNSTKQNTKTLKVEEEDDSAPRIIIDHSPDKLLKNSHTTF